MNDLGIVIPAYNEESSLAYVLDLIKKYCPQANILVVDDCSTDNTANIARSCGVEVISNPVNYNYGKALRIGFNSQVEKHHIKYLAFLDADATYPPERISDLYRAVKEQNMDIAVGSRFLGQNTGMPIMRKLGNKIFAWLASFYSGKHITDTATGLRLFKVELLSLFDSLPDGLNFTPAMTAALSFQNIKYIEVPIEYNRRAGKSKLDNVKDGYRFLTVIMNAARKYRPVMFYFTLGIPYLVLQSIVNMGATKSHLRRTN